MRQRIYAGNMLYCYCGIRKCFKCLWIRFIELMKEWGGKEMLKKKETMTFGSLDKFDRLKMKLNEGDM